MRLLHPALLLLAVLAAGCERPLVDPLDVSVQVVSPDLSRALDTPTLALELRADRGDASTRLRVAGATASLDTTRGVFQATLQLADGLNTLPVEILDGESVVARDTLYALFLDVRAVPTVDLTLPARAGATATLLSGSATLPGGATLLAGGVGGTGALATTTLLSATGDVTAGTLAAARAGHSASVLPSGDILLLGGATDLDPTSALQFVTTAEVLSPDGVSRGSVPIDGGAFLRVGHTARVLVDSGGRTVVYVYGGRDASAGPPVAIGTVAILEWTDGRLVRLTPPGGAGSFAEAAFHLQLDAPRGAMNAVVLGAGAPDSTPFRFLWREPGTNFPFDVRTTTVRDQLTVVRRAAAIAPIGDGLYLVAGGRTADGSVSDVLDVYASGPGRAFHLPASVGLSVARAYASAAILDGRRMVVVGGLTGSGAATAFSETFLY